MYAGLAQNQAAGTGRDSALSKQKTVPPPASPYILNQAFPPQPNSSFYITGMGTIGSTSDIPFTVNSSSASRTAILLANSSTPNGSWLLNVNNGATPDAGTFSLINLQAHATLTPIAAFTNGYVSINSAAPPVAALDVNGDIHASGVFMLGIQYLKQEHSMKQGYQAYTLDCPAGYQLISGGGGDRDLNGTIKDIQVAFSGPDEDAPATRWRLYLYNSSKSSRAVVINCTCAKVK